MFSSVRVGSAAAAAFVADLAEDDDDAFHSAAMTVAIEVESLVPTFPHGDAASWHCSSSVGPV